MQRRMPIVTVLLGVVVILVVGLPLGLGSRLPTRHTASIRTHVRAAPDAVYAALLDVESWPEWMPGYGPIRRGEPRGDHPVFESPADERTVLRYEVAERVPPSHLRILVDSSNRRFSAIWDFDVRSENGGASVTVRETARTNSPMLRFVMHYLTGYEVGIRGISLALERKFGTAEADAAR